MALLVCKFGGSSVASIDKIRKVALRLKDMQSQGNHIVVVVSAMGDTTDDLLELADEIGARSNLREMDMLLATGEQQTAALLALSLNSMQCPAISLSGWQAGIMTDAVHSKARIIGIKPERIQYEIAAGNIVVIAGFQGRSPANDISTLGRGGSDTTAVALAAIMGASRCLIFTDVNGVYTADPRIVKEARKLEQISYQEMLEMASLGAGVLQPRAAEFAMHYNVDVEVRNSFNNESGTIITEVSKWKSRESSVG